ncbi:MAG TPA: hypothetical protein VKB19_19765 [Pedobacter sp.]|nr:hypothetical protein [Pedobacter sp.]
MMRAKIKAWFELSKLTGIEINLGSEGVETVHACTLQISGDQLGIAAQNAGLKSIEHFAKNYKPGPVTLCLTGKGILTRQIAPVQVIDRQVISQILPNANAEEFYFQLYNSTEFSVVSLVRQSVADAVLAELERSGFQVLVLSLGSPDDDVPIASLRPELIPASQIAFQVLLGRTVAGVAIEQLKTNKLQAFAKAKVLGIAAVFGCILLVLLLINFFVFSHYQDAAGRLAIRRNQSGVEVKKFRQVESDIVQKTALITTAGWAGGYPYAWLTDQLMAGKPAVITISAFSINPLKAQKITDKREEVYENRKISISGSSDQAATLNNWLFEIRAKDWVSDCSIRDYELNKESGKGQFTIEIEIRDYEG